MSVGSGAVEVAAAVGGLSKVVCGFLMIFKFVCSVSYSNKENLHHVVFGRVQPPPKYSYRVWQLFAFNSAQIRQSQV